LTGGEPPDDYKFFCFDSRPSIVEVDTSRFAGLRRAFHDLDWRRLDITFVDPPIDGEVPRPASSGPFGT
jgi:hypothetical protein